MTEISFASATPDDKEAALGREFREIHVESADFSGAGLVVALIEGRRVALVGNPQEALTTYLGGVMAQIETQGEY